MPATAVEEELLAKQLDKKPPADDEGGVGGLEER
jgi:hypothetical protein